MNQQQWELVKKCANMEDPGEIPVGLIIDSPWIPGYLGISTIDYFTLPDLWLTSNLKIIQEYPEIIFLPGFWVEYGMLAEPSGFGCKSIFFENKTPNIGHIISSADDIDQISSLPSPNPKTDGLMPMILSRYKYANEKLKELGREIKMITARGPLTIASHLMGLTEFLIALKTDPDETHKLLKTATTLIKDWLQAQADALGSVEGMLVLDDVVGFLSEEDYLEFAHPYLKDIFFSFPEWIRMYHNDTENDVYFRHLEDLRIHLFNFSYKFDIAKVKAITGNKICLFGNISPFDVLAQGSPETVKAETLKMLKNFAGTKGLIVSAGGGVSPGTPGENIRAILDAVLQFHHKM